MQRYKLTRNQAIVAMAQRITGRQIAERFNVKPSRVSQILRPIKQRLHDYRQVPIVTCSDKRWEAVLTDWRSGWIKLVRARDVTRIVVVDHGQTSL